jgi:hypothetical protein
MQKLTTTTSPTQDKTECNQDRFEFPDLISRKVVFEANEQFVTGNAGGILLANIDRNQKIIESFAECFVDHRRAELVEHSLESLLRQRVYVIAMGYEDLNDHDRLRADPLLAACCGRDDVEGRNRSPEDEGKPLAGKSTLNRLELSAQDPDCKYKKITPKVDCLEAFFIDYFVDNLPKRTKEVVLDLDTTDDLIHGDQEGNFYHAYYDNYCYCPLYVFCGGMPVVSRLRTAESEHIEDTVEVMDKVVKALRKRFGHSLKILLRADSGFSRVELIQFCREEEVDFLFGFGGNKILKRLVRGTMRQVQGMFEYNKSENEKLYRELKYKPKTPGWKEEPKYRVVAKCEVNEQGTNTRFVMTSLPISRIDARGLYEDIYCARGDMENRIKEQKLDLKSDRTSTHWMASNQLRLWFSTLAYLLIHRLRNLIFQGTKWAKATCSRIRLDFFKVAATVKTSCRRVVVSINAGYPYKEVWDLALGRLLQLKT